MLWQCSSLMVFRITRVLSYITSEIYSVKPLPNDRMASILGRVKSDLSEWRAQLPPFLGSINPSSLASPFCKQAIMLRLAYSHVVIHASRPLLLGTIGGSSESPDATNEEISDCISSARLVLETVDSMASEDPGFHVFWWCHYVCFCALAVVYIWEIQRHLSTLYGQDYHEQLFELAERCQTHLAEATTSNSPGRRYSIILQELQAEAKRTMAGSALRSLSQHNGRQSSECDDIRAEGRDPTTRSHISQSASEAVDIDNLVVTQHQLWNNWQTTDWLEINSLVSFKIVLYQHLSDFS